MVYRSVCDIDFKVSDLPLMPKPDRVLLTRPTYFDVTYAINPHMAGQIGRVDRDKAGQQWERLRDIYHDLGYQVEVIEGAVGLPDMVFCANQSLPLLAPDGSRQVTMSRMYAPERRNEVSHYKRFFEQQGYTVFSLPSTVEGSFEGMGDALWHPGRRLLWGGHGFRTDPAVYTYLMDLLETPIILLELQDPSFYHLDTCLSILDERTALVYPEAFNPQDRLVIEHVFDAVIQAPEEEARELLACNAHCPDGTHVIIQEGCDTTVRELTVAGFTPIEIDLSEYLKAGGSVYCMKLMLF